MFWKNPLKRMKKNRSILDNPFFMMGAVLEQIKKANDNAPKTLNPQGKVGVVERVRTWNRKFGEGPFKFRRFEKKTFDGANGFIRHLERRGFERLGSGAFSTVLGKPGSDRVIKVIRRPDGWINYVVWAASIGQAGKFAPRVYSYKKYKGINSEFAVAIVERLKYTLEDAPEDHAKKILPGLIWRAENPMARQFVEVLAPGLMDYLAQMALKWDIAMRNFDFHEGNLMVREDGSFVVVDPVSQGEEGFTRLRAGELSPAVALRTLNHLGLVIARSNRYRSQWAA